MVATHDQHLENDPRLNTTPPSVIGMTVYHLKAVPKTGEDNSRCAFIDGHCQYVDCHIGRLLTVILMAYLSPEM